MSGTGSIGDMLDAIGLDRLPRDIIDRSLSDLVRLDGRLVVVTGAGGFSLGQAIASRMAGQGAALVMVDRDADGLARVASEIEARWGRRPQIFIGDVSDWDDAHRLVAEIAALPGGIDTWINNVGGTAPGEFWESDKAAIDHSIGVSLNSALYCTRALIEPMKRRGRGHIINISSEASKTSIPHLTAYAAAKAGVNRMTNALAAEVGRFGIRINAVSPGVMISPLIERLLQDPATNHDLVDQLKGGLARVTIGRASLPEEVANVVAFLASDAAGYVHGAVWSVSGGQSDY